MKLPPHVANKIRRGIEQEVKARPPSESLCIHLPNRTIEAIEKYLTENPHTVQTILVSLLKGDKSTLAHTLGMASTGSLMSQCADILCLSCRRELIVTRIVSSSSPNPEDLLVTAKFLGEDVMNSLKWVSKILLGTINSKRSSESHRKNARVALEKTIPLIALNASLVSSLQKDLVAAVEDRDKYHRLADMLMDKASAPTSSKD